MKTNLRETIGPATNGFVHVDAIGAGHALPKATVENAVTGSRGRTRLCVPSGMLLPDADAGKPKPLIDGAIQTGIRELDDEAIDRADRTLGHIDGLKVPRATGTISDVDTEADLYQIRSTALVHRRPATITIFRSGGDTRPDLMIANAILHTGTGQE